MPTRPIDTFRKESLKFKAAQTAESHCHIQHGQPQNISLLLDVPAESLTHITSFLPPPSLLALSRTNRRLYEHIKDDNTWFRAFLNQIVGISPENDIDNGKLLLLRRTGNSWRKEFISRYSVRRRWERSRNPTITHSPQDSSIDGVHLMSENGLLTSSMQYGVVARSVPLNGKVLKGYLDASGTGLGIGNPNVEFTPNVSACAITSDGGTARIIWGKRNGEVAITMASKVMDPGRATSKLTRCNVEDQHEGVVQQVVLDFPSNTFVSAGTDGRVKIWESRSARCLWSSEKQVQRLVTDPFVCVTGSLSQGCIVGALNSGNILLWVVPERWDAGNVNASIVLNEYRIMDLLRNDRQPANNPDLPLVGPKVTGMWLRRKGSSQVTLLIQYSDHPSFYSVSLDIRSGNIETTRFGESSGGHISIVEPILARQPLERNIVFVGDQLGFVAVYDADTASKSHTPPVHQFEAHAEGAITALAWNAFVLATGSSRGTTAVWDALTLEPLRYFTSPASRPAPGHDWGGVSRILLEKELVVIVVGNRVMTWKLGQINGHVRRHQKARHADTKRSHTSKGHQRYEMYKDIAESRRQLEYETARTQRVLGREREQRSTLESLGLSEQEAVEYILMLSREEEERRRLTTDVDEGVFEGDFDDIPTPPHTPSSPLLSSRHSSSSSLYHSNGRPYPRVALPTSNEKVQISPPFIPEPMEAGTSISPLQSTTFQSSTLSGAVALRNNAPASHDDFPAMSSSFSSTSSTRGGRTLSQSTSSSPDQPHSAWSTPMRSVPPSPSLMSPIARASSSRALFLTPNTECNREVENREKLSGLPEEMDDDLKFAIELSLAEARSRGEL
ncbi:WD40-repeat-containing domain protein [Phlebopus sp. FC_14]|nr:WD40-repeat-containing domain protein [Phlebopus sp. FC_14]